MANTGSYIAMSFSARKGANLRPRGVGHNLGNDENGFVGGDLERETGFEPATSTLARLRSTN